TRTFPARLPATLDAQHGKLRRLPSEFSISCLPLSLDLVVGPRARPHQREVRAPDIRYQGSDRHHPTLGHRVLNRAHDPRCGTRPPTHSTRQKSARALLRLSYRGDGRAPANSV